MIEIVLVKGANINDQIITWLSNFEATGVTCIVGFRFCVCSRVEILADKTRESNAVIIGIIPCADNHKNILSSFCVAKLVADGKIFLQFLQKILMIRDAFAPTNVGNRRIVITNITREDLESAVIVFCVEVLLSLPRVVCKRRDRHGAKHGNCQQCSQQLFDYFLHHDLQKSPFKFF